MSVESNRLKQIRREADPNIGTRRLENHHITARFQGGDPGPSNQYSLTLPEHALAHFIEARTATDKDGRNGNYWAVSKIVARMEGDELPEFSRMLLSYQRRKGKGMGCG